MSNLDFGAVVERYHAALGEFFRGNAEPAVAFFSPREDVTLGNPFGPFVRGQKRVAEVARLAATHYKDGADVTFEPIAKIVTAELGVLVEIERCTAKIGGSPDRTALALRVTSVFRHEDGGWKLFHRHADPITSSRPATSVIAKRDSN